MNEHQSSGWWNPDDEKIMIDSIITKLVVGCRTLHTDIGSEPWSSVSWRSMIEEASILIIRTYVLILFNSISREGWREKDLHQKRLSKYVVNRPIFDFGRPFPYQNDIHRTNQNVFCRFRPYWNDTFTILVVGHRTGTTLSLSWSPFTVPERHF